MKTNGFFRKGSRYMAMAVLGLLCLAQFAGYANAEQRGSIEVIKQWEGDGSRPEELTLYLMRDGRRVSSICLSAADATEDGSWHGQFENVPLYGENGEEISYTVWEESLPGYLFSVSQQPRAEGIRMIRWGEKITPASERSYDVGKANLLVANKGGSYYVWTLEPLTAVQKERLMERINAAGLQGLGKNLSIRNTLFESGLPAEFSEGIRLAEKAGGITMAFSKTNVWSLFYAGSCEWQEAQSAVLVNRVLSPTASPSASPAVQPSSTPAPQESEPPKTGDESGARITAGVFALSLLGSGYLMKERKKT